MEKDRKIGIIGHFGGTENILDGQTIKTKILYNEIKMLREEFKESLKEILKVTKKETNDLYLIVKSSIICN